MKLCLLPLVALLPLTVACTVASEDPDNDASASGGQSGTGSTSGTGADAGTGGETSSTGGGTGLPSSGITTEALETVKADFWPANMACSATATFASGPVDDGTGNVVMHLKADGHAGTCDGGSPSVSLSISQADLTDDVARSKGVKFHIRASAATTIRFLAQSAEVVPMDQGGACPTDEFCWNAHEKSLSLTDQWQEVTILWDDLTQTWGIEDGDKKANVVVLYPSDIQLLSWALDGTTGGEIWIDGIELIANDGTGVKSGIESVISKAQFNAIVGASASYTYEGFVAAAKFFPAFAGAADPAEAKREVAAFLANAKWETGNFQFTEEQTPGTYCDTSKPYMCPAGAGAYFGRGALQLSWNYNYHDAGQYLGIDLLNNPSQVATNPDLLWETAIWFWMRPGTAGTAHNVFKSGFGETIRVINPIECGGGNSQAVNGRVENYNAALSVLATDAAGTSGGC